MAKVTVSQPCEALYTLVLTEREIVALDAVVNNEAPSDKIGDLRRKNDSIYKVGTALGKALRG